MSGSGTSDLLCDTTQSNDDTSALSHLWLSQEKFNAIKGVFEKSLNQQSLDKYGCVGQGVYKFKVVAKDESRSDIQVWCQGEAIGRYIQHARYPRWDFYLENGEDLIDFHKIAWIGIINAVCQITA